MQLAGVLLYSSCSQECSRLLVILYSEQRSDLLHSVVSGLRWALSQLYQPGNYNTVLCVSWPFHCLVFLPSAWWWAGGWWQCGKPLSPSYSQAGAAPLRLSAQTSDCTGAYPGLLSDVHSRTCWDICGCACGKGFGGGVPGTGCATTPGL